MGVVAMTFGMQLFGKLVLPQLLERLRGTRPNVIKYREAEIDMATLMAAYSRQLVKVQQHNDSIFHDFHVHVNETTSTIHIISTVMTTNRGENGENNSTSSANDKSSAINRSMQISSLTIRMANLTDADLTLSTQFITNWMNSTKLTERHQEFVQEN